MKSNENHRSLHTYQNLPFAPETILPIGARISQMKILVGHCAHIDDCLEQNRRIEKGLITTKIRINLENFKNHIIYVSNWAQVGLNGTKFLLGPDFLWVFCYIL